MNLSFSFRSTFVICCAILLSACSASAPLKRVGTAAPLSRIVLLNGDYLPFPLYDGRKTALMFWASWCPTSRSRMEDFNALAARHKGDRGLWFLAVSIDTSGDERQYMEYINTQSLNAVEHAFSGNAELDEAYMSYGLDNIPYFYLIDSDGTILTEGTSASSLFSS